MTIYTSPWGQLDRLPTGNAVAEYEAGAEANPDDSFAIDAPTGTEITFAQARRVAHQFATVLHDKYDIQRGDVVCLFGFNHIYLQPLHFAILILGAVVSPANVMYTASELAHQVRTAGVKLVLAEPEVRAAADGAVAEAGRGRVVSYQQIRDEIAALVRDESAPETAATPLDGRKEPAYYSFSSGTSGLPKCVIITHSNIMGNVMQVSKALEKEENLRELQGMFLPMSHIMGLNAGVWATPYRGAGQVIMPRFDFIQMLDNVIKYKIKRIALVPPMLNAVARHPIMQRYLPKLNEVVLGIRVGAAPTSDETIALVKKRMPQAELSQGYGMTESSPVCLIGGWNDNRDYNFASSGWLVPHCEARLVDPNTGKDVPLGERGEFWIRGPQVMAGYLHNPEATAETLVEGGWLRTGDVMTTDKTGQFYVVDRIKELIKSMGHQVAPAELEGILLNHEDVVDAGVIGIADRNQGTEMPRAYLVLKPSGDIRKVIAWFNGRVSKPKRLWGGAVQVEEIPKSASGKILRRELRDRADQDKNVVGHELAKL